MTHGECFAIVNVLSREYRDGAAKALDVRSLATDGQSSLVVEALRVRLSKTARITVKRPKRVAR